MATVSIRVPEDLKKRMDQVDVNWSDLLREAIEERLLRAQREEAFRKMDELREAIVRRGGKPSNVTEEIRKWRRLR